MPSPATPKQARALRTREKILLAAEELLADRLFEDLSIDEIVAAASCSVGSFYHLFGEKNGLLSDLYTRHSQDVERRLTRIMQSDSGRSVVSQRISKLSRELVRYHRQRRGLLRALVLRSHTHPATVAAQRPQDMNTVIARLAKWLAGNEDKRSQQSAAEAILIMLATIRECILYPETTAQALRISDRRLQKMLEQMCSDYLGGPVKNATARRKKAHAR